MALSRKSTAVAVIALAFAVLLGGAVAWASIPAPDGTINGCRKNTDGSIRVIDSATACPTGWTALNWSQTGPVGPTGPSGMSGFSRVSSAESPTILPGLSGTTQATCPVGETAISGGWSFDPEIPGYAPHVTQSVQDDLDPRSWNVTVRNDSPETISGAGVIAYCVTIAG